MNPSKRIITSLLALATLITVNSQELLNFIPKEASVVAMMNLKQINSKANFEDLSKLPFIQKIHRKMLKKLSVDEESRDSAMLLSMSKYGVNVDTKIYSYYINLPKISYGGLLLSISDQVKFKDFVKLITEDPEGTKIEPGENFSQSYDKDMHIIWNQNAAFLFGASISGEFRDSIDAAIYEKYEIIYDDYNYDNSYTDSALVEPIQNENEYEVEPENGKTRIAYNEFYRIKDSITETIKYEWLAQNVKQLLSNKGTNSFASNAEFQEYVKNSPDAAMVIDYDLFIKGYGSYLFGMARRSSFNNFPGNLMMSMYKGMKIYSKINFNKDQIDLSIDTKYSESINRIISKSKKKKLSKKFLNYMDKNMMGYIAFGFDIESTMEATRETIKQEAMKYEKYGKAIASALDIISIIVDEKAVYNIFSGDAAIVINGVTEQEVIHKTYDYDEEFNQIERMDTTKQMMPDFEVMIGVGNRADVQKLIELGIHSEVFEKEGNIYNVKVRRNKLPVYFKIVDDILFIGNNKKCIENPALYIQNGKLSKEHIKLFKKNTVVGFANTSDIARYAGESTTRSRQIKSMDETAKLFQTVTMNAKYSDGFMHSNYQINLSLSDENSIADILKFFNVLYLIDTKKI